ncbi:hypothetical protein Ga0466249_002079 [Sporomusaceae bacterium BoRhaA]|uniref:hypothetical protein n=1 Tax=Pelorhabdus rhamnosifermentans TaxID=2772457 RepID=UPI001C060290|nr:hypothetical protein [Pelorhabdus rhamnosifermentans]MBU2700968.1 hypothetical protein [Pelorhabdus rhamnosifermentans]
MRASLKRLMMATMAASLFTLVNFAPTDAAVPMDVVLRWAPVMEQQNYSTSPVDRVNVFTKVNFDQDWRTNNNSMNLPFVSVVDPEVYYSLVESTTHYFVGYYLYYPRYGGDEEHENDMIGVLMALRKPGLEAKNVDMILAYSNGKWKQWKSFKNFSVNSRFMISMQSGTHEIETLGTLPKAGSLFFYPQSSLHKEQPSYRLTDLGELWQHRNDIGPGHVFSRWGYFDGYYYTNTALPWIWTHNGIQWLSNPGELMQDILHLPKTAIIYQNNEYR